MTDPSTDVVHHEISGATSRITINRPDRRNAISPEVVRGIATALAEVEAQPTVKVVVLTGAGDKAFCAGGDLGGMAEAGGKVGEHFVRAEIGDLFKQMRASRLPIVARVNGHALAGGFGLMLACDIVVAASDAGMGMPEVNIGLWPFMISAIVQRDIPRKIALEMMMTGRRFDAATGERWGFVNRVVDRDGLDAATYEIVDEIASKSAAILSLGKRSFYRAEDMPVDDALGYLAGMLTVCLGSEDTIEGVTAFIQKRAPEWKDR